MHIIEKIKDMQELADIYREKRKTIGFVPTMGALHEGHLKLVHRAHKKSDIVVVSIFVNPLQFGPKEDYKVYPRNFKKDCMLLEKQKVDIVFSPSLKEMYSVDFSTYVHENQISIPLCSKSRPGHFNGVATVLIKLFSAVKPHFVFMGQKDAQQVLLTERLVRDFNLDIQVITLPIIRDKNGLALSSRNQFLTDEGRSDALALYEALTFAKIQIALGQTEVKRIINKMKKIIETKESIRVDYIEILSYPNLMPLPEIDRKVIIAIAAWANGVRLIDNMIVDIK